MKRLLSALLALGFTAVASANGFYSLEKEAMSASRYARKAYASYESQRSEKTPGTGELEVAFSPNEGAEALVIKVVQSARKQLLILSYSFASSRITEAVLEAHRRGVRVSLVADEKFNLVEDRSGKGRAALSALANAGVDVRVISVYPIHHDKVMIADGETVELGSFNYSVSAATKNSENVLVNWNNQALAAIYQRHFERNYQQSHPYTPRY